jgi:hypothetical protein
VLGILVAWGMLGAPCNSVAGVASIGGLPGAYLRAPVGAEAAAMGGAAAANVGLLSPWWNAASLVDNRTAQAGLGMGVRSQGRTEGFGAFDFRIPPRVSMGFVLLYRGDPFIDGLHDENENLLKSGSYTTLTLKTGLGFLATRTLSLGLSFGVYYQRLPTGYLENASLEYSSATGIGGFDFSTRWKVSNDWTLAIALRNVAAATDWQISSETWSYNATINEKLLPEFVLASRLNGALGGSPLVWTCDVSGYYFDGDWKPLPHADAVIGTGVAWQRWKTFCLRAGLGDVAVNGSIVQNATDYFDTFSMRLTAGFGWDLALVRKGLSLNYAVASDKAWAGIDQALDVGYSF